MECRSRFVAALAFRALQRLLDGEWRCLHVMKTGHKQNIQPAFRSRRNLLRQGPDQAPGGLTGAVQFHLVGDFRFQPAEFVNARKHTVVASPPEVVACTLLNGGRRRLWWRGFAPPFFVQTPLQFRRRRHSREPTQTRALPALLCRGCKD